MSTKTKTTAAATVEDMRDELSDVQKTAESVVDSLSCADGSETDDEFRANIDDAIDAARSLLAELLAMKGGAK